MDAVIFDMDGVLFDTERLYLEAWIQVTKEYGIIGIEEAARGCIGRNKNGCRTYMQSIYGQDFNYDHYRDAVDAWVKNHIKVYGIPIKAGVKALLEYLKKREIPTALATSTIYQTTLDHLTSAGLADYFQVLVTGEMIEHSKPNPDIYLLACRKLGVSPMKSYAIEDSPNGLLAAYRAGLKVLLVPDLVEPTKEMRDQSFMVLRDLNEATAYFRKIV